MKLINPFYASLSLSIVAFSLLSQPAFAGTTAAGQDKLRVHTGIPKKATDSLLSYTAEWRQDEGELYRATGLSFLNAASTDNLASSGVIAKKLAAAMTAGMTELYPSWRGITTNYLKDQPELTIANKAGYSLTSVTFRDYTNQALSYDVVDKSFTDAGVQIAIDMVLAADVEYLEGFTTLKPQKASQGDIAITIDGQNPIHIKTDGKTTRELEEEISRQLTSSQLSEIPLFPNLIGSDTRNSKPFDGSEVQILNPTAKSIAIDITDPNLGVLTKFKFKDENSTVKVVEPRSMLLIAVLTSILAAGYFWFTKTKKQA